jgi:hypothetical protein
MTEHMDLIIERRGTVKIYLLTLGKKYYFRYEILLLVTFFN